MFKAFQKLAIQTQEIKKQFVNKGTSRYAFYLRLLRKSLYSLKLFAQNRQKYRNARQLSNMFIQKRWLTNLQTASQIR